MGGIGIQSFKTSVDGCQPGESPPTFPLPYLSPNPLSIPDSPVFAAYHKRCLSSKLFCGTALSAHSGRTKHKYRIRGAYPLGHVRVDLVDEEAKLVMVLIDLLVLVPSVHPVLGRGRLSLPTP